MNGTAEQERLGTRTIDALTLAVNAVASMATDIGAVPVGIIELAYYPGDDLCVAWLDVTLSRRWCAPIEDLPGNGFLVRTNRERARS